MPLQEWTAKDGAAAQQLVAKLQGIAEQNGHPLSHVEAVSSTVIAEITTAVKGESIWECVPQAAAKSSMGAPFCTI